ncbi:hypothetical protein SMICM17S_10871 [Streptomyces microflavus]
MRAGEVSAIQEWYRSRPVAVRPYRRARSEASRPAAAIRCGVRSSSSATKSSASRRSCAASGDRPKERDGSIIAAGSVQRSSLPRRWSSVAAVQGSSSSASSQEARWPWSAVRACRGLAAPVISRGPSNPAKRRRSEAGRPSLYSLAQRTSSRLAADAPNPWLNPCSMASCRVPSPPVT